MFMKKNLYLKIINLRFLPNVLLTPHIGYVTAENYQIFYSQMIESLEACVNGKPIRVIE